MKKINNFFKSVSNGSLDEIARSIHANNINLTKEEYFKFRKDVLPEYQRKISERVREGDYSDVKVSSICKILTDFTRYQHYNLVNSELSEKRRKNGQVETEFDVEDLQTNLYSETEKDGMINDGYVANWKESDDVLYALERKVWRNNILENRRISVSNEDKEKAFRDLDERNGNYDHIDKSESELIKLMPTKYLSRYKLKVINMMKNKVFNPGKLFNILNRNKSRVA